MFKVTFLKLKTIIKFLIISISFLIIFKFLIPFFLSFKFNEFLLSNNLILNKKTFSKHSNLFNKNSLLAYEIPLFKTKISDNFEEINNSYNINSINTSNFENSISNSVNENTNTENSITSDNEDLYISKINTIDSTTTIPNNVPNKFNVEYRNVKIKNTSKYSLNDNILNYDHLNIDKENILIFHTHTCESYTPTNKNSYKASGNYRTIDLNFSVSRVGEILEKNLNLYNYNTFHDKTFHDYPAYTDSYGRSLETVKNILNSSNKKYDIIIDIHRDAIADANYAPSIQIGDEIVSQLMFVIGTDGGGLDHPNWNQNLQFAIKVQNKANELYPRII